MLPEIEKLLVLQDRDRKIRTLKQELHFAPQQRKEFEDKLAATNKQLETVKLKAKEIEVERKKLENDAQAKRDSIAKFQTQKFQTRKNEEFQALNNEITRYEGDIRAIEDKELELMDAVEKSKVAVAEAEQQAKTVKGQVDRQLADITGKIDAVGAQLKELETERAGLAVGVDEDLLDTFDRLFANKGEAVVPLENEICMGCHMKVTTQTVVKVKGQREIVHCEQCGRILYRGS
jgi:predicted  nucleic acid-binding Zn-ribbon protein